MDDRERDYLTQRAIEATLPYSRKIELAIMIGQFGYRPTWQAITLDEMIAVGGWLMEYHRKRREEAERDADAT